MKARVPKSWQNLPKAQREAIVEHCHATSKEVAAEEMEKIHETICKLACIALNDSLGLGCQRLDRFMQEYRNKLKEYAKWQADEVEQEKIEIRIAELFPEGFIYE